MSDKKISIYYILAILASVYFTWIFHEFFHWICAESLGYDAVLQLNKVYPSDGRIWTDIDNVYVSASGPIITIIQAIIVYFLLIKRNWNKLLYPFLFAPLYMRLLAGAMNAIKPNDEGRISEYFDLGLYTISIIVSTFLFFLVYKVSKRYKLGWKFNLITTLLIMLFSSILILSDQAMGFKIIP